MDLEAVFRRVIELFATMADTDGEITAESELIEDLGISSMAALILLTSLEEEFKIKIPEKALRKMVTIEDVVDTVVSLMK